MSDDTIVYILNDTSYEKHAGCLGVMDQIHKIVDAMSPPNTRVKTFSIKQIRQAKKEIIRQHPTHIIINGEGTFHSDSKNGIRWMRFASEVRIKYQTKIALINASWFRNKSLNSLLDICDLIYMRDQQSVKNASSVNSNLKIGLATDLFYFFCINNDPHFEKGGKLQYCNDSVNFGVRERLRDFGKRFGIFGTSMFIADGPIENLSIIMNTFSKRRLGSINYIKSFILSELYFQKSKSMSEFMLRACSSSSIHTGRYHMVVLCLATGRPFLYYDTNTPKIESLLHDVGLSGRKARPTIHPEIPKFSEMEKQLLIKFNDQSHIQKEKLEKEIQAFLERT